MGKIVIPKEDLIIRKPENLVKARYKLSPLAIKFLSTIIANIKISDDVDQEYILQIKSFQEFTGQKTNRIYELVEEALENLLKNPLKIPLDKEETKFLMCNWISSAIYDNGEVNFLIDKRLRPILLQVKEKFLKYRLENILPLRSGYSIRLYEILKDIYNRETGYGKLAEIIYTLKDIREKLEVPKSYVYGMLKKRILEKAKTDLEQYTDIIFDYEEIKTGRKIAHLKFTIRANPAKTEAYKESKITKHLKSIKYFVSFLRKNYVDKCFGYNLSDKNICWLKINDKGLIYGVLDNGEQKHFNSLESERMYRNWLEIAKADWFYQRVILEDIEDFKEFYNKELDFRLNFKETIALLQEENKLK